MKYILPVIIITLIISCNGSVNEPDQAAIENMAMEFMKTDVIPHMKEPKPYEVTGAKMVIKRAGDLISEYDFTLRNLSFTEADSVANQRHLDSVKRLYPDPEEVVDITVNVSYNTKYRRGNVVTDSVKLGYNTATNKISYWPF